MRGFSRIGKNQVNAPKSELRKIGYGLVIVGIIALVHAWLNIFQYSTSLWELLFLFIGLIATLGGINLVIRNAADSNHPLQPGKSE